MVLLNEEAVRIVMEVYPHSNVRTTYIWKTERFKAVRANTLNLCVGDQEENSGALP